MTHEFEDKVVIVTAAAHGIGRATARLFAERGARVVAADINQSGLEDLVNECCGLGADMLPCVFDQRSSQSVTAMVSTAYAAFGRVDVLANVVGIYPFAPVAEMTDEFWAETIEINLSGTFYCCRAVLPGMLAQGSGAIVNTASGEAVRPSAGHAAYGASKAGIITFSRALALEAAPLVRVNVVSPGPTDTGWRTRVDLGDAEASAATAAATDTDIPLGRLGEPVELAEAIAFLASERASFISGQGLFVNGGRLMM
jgi:3-oxoacyl-[acyl-carrier protein] reductase